MAEHVHDNRHHGTKPAISKIGPRARGTRSKLPIPKAGEGRPESDQLAAVVSHAQQLGVESAACATKSTYDNAETSQKQPKHQRTHHRHRHEAQHQSLRAQGLTTPLLGEKSTSPTDGVYAVGCLIIFELKYRIAHIVPGPT